jgi:hypothetical protein
MSLALTRVCKLFRIEFLTFYLERVPLHLTTRHSTAFFETFFAHGNSTKLTSPHRDTRATLEFHPYHLHVDGKRWYPFVDIKSLVLLAQQFPNTVYTLAEREDRMDKSGNSYLVQSAKQFFERFIQIEEFRPELLSALAHDIASIYLGQLGSNDYTIVFKKTCTRI